MSNKRQKFIELAESRVNRTLNDIRLISNLSNRSAYEYDEEDAKRIFSTLRREIDTAELRFRGQSARQSSGFRIGDA